MGAGLAWLCSRGWKERTPSRWLSSGAPDGIAPVEKSGVEVEECEFLRDEIVREQLTRNLQFFGEQGQAAVSSSLVVVVGLGVSVSGPISGDQSEIFLSLRIGYCAAVVPAIWVFFVVCLVFSQRFFVSWGFEWVTRVWEAMQLTCC